MQEKWICIQVVVCGVPIAAGDMRFLLALFWRKVRRAFRWRAAGLRLGALPILICPGHEEACMDIPIQSRSLYTCSNGA